MSTAPIGTDIQSYRVIRNKHIGRYVAAVVTVLLLLSIVLAFARGHAAVLLEVLLDELALALGKHGVFFKEEELGFRGGLEELGEGLP